MHTTLLRLSVLLALLSALAASASAAAASDGTAFDASALRAQAAHALATGDRQLALSLWDRLISHDADDAHSLLLAGTLRARSATAAAQSSLASAGHAATSAQALRTALAQLQHAATLRPALAREKGAHEHIAAVALALGEFERAASALDEDTSSSNAQLLSRINAASTAASRAHKASTKRDYPACVTHARTALEHAPASFDLRTLRAACLLDSLASSSSSSGGAAAHAGTVAADALADLGRAAALSPSMPAALLVRASYLSALFASPPGTSDDGHDDGGGEGRRADANAGHWLAAPKHEALTHVKRCLHTDPDNKLCLRAHKKLKALERALAKLGNWRDAHRHGEVVLSLAGEGGKDQGMIKLVQDIIDEAHLGGAHDDGESVLPRALGAHNSLFLTALYESLCRAHLSLGRSHARKATHICVDVLGRREPDNVWALVGLAEKQMADDEFQDAVRTLEKAHERSGRQEREIGERLQKAQKLLRQASIKDYYKVLGVSRDATDREIKKAYRKASMTAHPDKGGSEAKMAEVNQAYEVLSTPELRQRFDNGEDPNDPMANAGGSGGPFQQGPGPEFFQQFFAGGSGFPGGGGGGFHGGQRARGGGGQQFKFHWG